MSAPQTNLEKQKRRHRGPLLGMALVLCFVALLFLGYLFVVADDGGTPRQTSPTIDGATGDRIEIEPAVTPDASSAPAPVPDAIQKD